MDTEGLLSTTSDWLRRLMKENSSRGNGIRPFDITHHVPLELYPDPVEFGWIFTGSNEVSRVEFFEKDGVKLDWYYTTATLKTSLDHPKQGKTQLFLSGNNMDPEVYIRVLLDPRAHTGQRYHQKPTNKQPRNKNRRNNRRSQGN